MCVVLCVCALSYVAAPFELIWNDQQMEWSAAHSYCTSLGGEFPAIHGRLGNMRLSQAIYAIDQFENTWLGANDNENEVRSAQLSSSSVLVACFYFIFNLLLLSHSFFNSRIAYRV